MVKIMSCSHFARVGVPSNSVKGCQTNYINPIRTYAVPLYIVYF